MRINLFGAGNRGKSTLASYLFYKFKKAGYKIELVNEYVKDWVYLGRKINEFDQIYILGKQLNSETIKLNSGKVEHIITDSPVLLSYIYAKYYNRCFADNLKEIIKVYDQRYPAINILLNNKYAFDKDGRFNSEAETDKIHKFMQKELSKYCDDNLFTYWNHCKPQTNKKLYENLKLLIDLEIDTDIKFKQ